MCNHLYKQVGNGVKLLSASSDQMEIDTTGMPACILSTAPSDCTNGGATYMFWIKQLDDLGGNLITTTGGKTEGCIIHVTTGSYLSMQIVRKGSSGNKFYKEVPGMDDFINTWLHVAIVWYPEPIWMIRFYFDGTEINPNDPCITDGSKDVTDSELRMILGRESLNCLTSALVQNMIFDELYLYDKLLFEEDIQAYVAN